MTIAEKIRAMHALLHTIPELALEEEQTTAVLRQLMERLPVEELKLPTATGAAFRLRCGKDAAAVCLRADIDGLAAEEAQSHALRSRIPGRMHACGHDVHMASLYGAALTLAERRRELERDVIFLFQPSEETASGAKPICDSGFLEENRVEAVYGLHNMPNLTVGTVEVGPGQVMAAKDSFTITVTGRSGHGATPEKTRDPIVAGAAIVTAAQSIVSRNLSPLEGAVVSITSIHCGHNDNRIEDSLTMEGSARTLSEEARHTVHSRLEEIAEFTARAYGCGASVAWKQSHPGVVNSERLLGSAIDAAREVFGEDDILGVEKKMISEDFCYYGQHVPAFFFFLGSGFPDRENAPLHSALFEAHPDTAVYGARLLAQCALVRNDR